MSDSHDDPGQALHEMVMANPELSITRSVQEIHRIFLIYTSSTDQHLAKKRTNELLSDFHQATGVNPADYLLLEPTLTLALQLLAVDFKNFTTKAEDAWMKLGRPRPTNDQPAPKPSSVQIHRPGQEPFAVSESTAVRRSKNTDDTVVRQTMAALLVDPRILETADFLYNEKPVLRGMNDSSNLQELVVAFRALLKRPDFPEHREHLFAFLGQYWPLNGTGTTLVQPLLHSHETHLNPTVDPKD